MKIYNLPVAKTDNVKLKSNSNNPSFKSLSPIAQKQLKTAISSNTSKELFVKLAGIAGLAGLVTWVKTLTNSSNVGVSDKLNKLDFNWSQKGNGLFLDPKTQGEYLNLVSESDSAESLMWAKGMISKVLEPVETREQTPEEIAMFLSPESNDTYLSVSANKTINSLVSQLNALLNAPEDVKTTALKGIESRLNALVQTANELQNAEESSAIYSKVANILKMFTLINFIDIKEVVGSGRSSASFKEDPLLEVEIPAVNSAGAVGNADFSENPEVNPGATAQHEPVIVGKIELPADNIRRFKSRPTVSESKSAPIISEELKPLPINAENKDFIENVFKPSFNRTARVDCRIYSDYIDLIKNIYEAYPEEKKSLRTQLLKRLKLDNLTSFLDSYNRFTENKKTNAIDFLSFVNLELVKRANEGTLSKEDFDKLTELRRSTVKFYSVTGRVDQKITLAFFPETNFDVRLDAIKEFHRIIYNIPDENLFSDSSKQDITSMAVTEELIAKIINNIDDYRNVIAFLDIDVTDVESELKNGTKEEAKQVANEVLGRPLAKKNIENLVELVSNKAFNDIAGGIQARMRFLERMVFNNPSNLSKSTYELKKITSKAVLDLKKQIVKSSSVDVINYPARIKGATLENRLFGPRVFLRDYTIGLNGSAKIHTIF